MNKLLKTGLLSLLLGCAPVFADNKHNTFQGEDWDIVVISQAAASGDINAQNKLGTMYLLGIGTEPNAEEAINWLKMSADSGNNLAAYNLARAYEGQSNFEQAVYYYKQAAEAGNMYAQTNLGNLYAQGLGVEKDPVIATSWYEKAAAQGDDLAKKIINDMQQTPSIDDMMSQDGAEQDYGQMQ